jgi:opacity protein-like surface antigen
MRKLMTTGVLFGLLAMTALAADITGKWTAQMPGRGGQGRGGQGRAGQGGGQAHVSTFNFKVDGNMLTGTVSGRQGDMPIADGKIDGDQISFTQTLDFNGNTVKLIYKGTVSGDQITLTRQREGDDRQPQEFIAKRAQ